MIPSLFNVGPRLTESRIDRMGFWSTFTDSIWFWIDRTWHILKILVNHLCEGQDDQMELQLISEKSSQLGSQNKKTACYVTDETNVTNVIEF